jgi:hypothetical protein
VTNFYQLAVFAVLRKVLNHSQRNRCQLAIQVPDALPEGIPTVRIPE